MMSKHLHNTGLILLTIIGSYVSAGAQSIHFTSQVQSNQVGINEPFQIQYVLDGANEVNAINPPAFKGFDVIQNFQYSQTNINNGQVTQSITVTYVLQPQKPGTFTIPGATATVNGKTFTSNPIVMKVSREEASSQGNQPGNGNSNPASSPTIPVPGQGGETDPNNLPGLLRPGEDPMAKIKRNVFARVEVDKTRVFEGEQITATYKLYTRLQTTSQINNMPSFSGFSTQDLDIPNPPQAKNEMIGGKKFKVFTIRKTILFPLQSGTLVLEPVDIQNTVRLYRMNSSHAASAGDNDPLGNFFKDPFNDPFFNDPFGNSGITYQDYNYDLKSDPVDIQVAPLPIQNQPADFTGGVGDFKMTSTLDKTRLKTGDAATLRVTISGAGNINLLQAPRISFPGSFDSYDPKITDHLIRNSIPFSGSRTFEYVFMPKNPGDYTIPAVAFSYFDPDTKSYLIQRSDSFRIQVAQGTGMNSSALDYATMGNRMAPQWAGTLAWSRAGSDLWRQGWYWTLLTLPLALSLFWILWSRYQAAQRSDMASFAGKRANRVALKRLSQASGLLAQNQQKSFYEATSLAIWGYLSQRLNIPFGELGKEKVQGLLQRKKVPDPQIQSLFSLLEECEQALYASSGGREQMQTVYGEGIRIISALEGKLK